MGNVFDMIPRSAHASRLRKKVVVQSVMYVICLVEILRLFASVPVKLRKMAPSNLMCSLLAFRIFVFTGMTSLVVRPSELSRFLPAKQL